MSDKRGSFQSAGSAATKNDSIRTTNSATEAMRRAANTMIALTETFRQQFREQESRRRPTTLSQAHMAEGSPSAPLPTLQVEGSGGPSEQVHAEPAPVVQQPGENQSEVSGELLSAFHSSSSSGDASSAVIQSSPPLPALPSTGFSAVRASPVPSATYAPHHPAPETAQIDSVTPTVRSTEQFHSQRGGVSSSLAPSRTTTRGKTIVVHRSMEDIPERKHIPHGQTVGVPGLENFPPPDEQQEDVVIPNPRPFGEGPSRPVSSTKSNRSVDLLAAAQLFHSVRPDSGYHGLKRDSEFLTPPSTAAKESATLASIPRTEETLTQDPARTTVPAPPSPAREVLMIVMICLAQLLLFAGCGQALVPVAQIASSFAGARESQFPWFTATYCLAAGIAALPGARLSQILGQRHIFIAGFVWCALWSVLAGLAVYVERGGRNALVYLCVCRAMQGVGIGLVMPSGYAVLIGLCAPGRRRGIVLCVWSVSGPLGFVLGAVMASLFANLMSWEWSFFAFGAVCVTLACQAVLIIPEDQPRTSKDRAHWWLRIDFPGMVLSVLGLGLVAVAWNEATVASWSEPQVYTLLVAGAVLLGAFVFVEHTAPQPLLPLTLLANPTILCVIIVAALSWGSFAIWLFYTARFIIEFRDQTPLLASASFVPLPLSALAAGLLATFLLRRGERAAAPWVLFIAVAAQVLGTALAVTAPIHRTYWANTFISTIAVPFGASIATPLCVYIIDQTAADQHRATAPGLVFASSFTFASIALGVAGTVWSKVGQNGSIDGSIQSLRGAQYTGVGMAGLALVLGLVLAVHLQVRRKKLGVQSGQPTSSVV